MTHKRRTHYIVDGCMAEVCELGTDDGSTRSLVLESEDPALVTGALRSLGLTARANVCMVRGLKALIGFGAVRYAVIDVGTNSVKLHVGERRADDTWTAVADRAIVTRLGEGLGATGALEPEPMARTQEAIERARRRGAPGRRGRHRGRRHRRAARRDERRRVRRAPSSLACGVRIEIIPGEEEARLAYLAATSELGLPPGRRVVFDTGGGSSQFTFGDADVVDEQFSVPARRGRPDRAPRARSRRFRGDAARHARPHRRRARPPRRTTVARRARRDGRRADQPRRRRARTRGVRPRRRARHPAGPRPRSTGRSSCYRTRGADERRAIVGLQPNRAEVILAGACVVRAVLTKLGCESLVVSDRGLRHWLIADRFGLGPPVAER